MKRIVIRTGETLQVWDENESLPKDGGFVKDKKGLVRFVSVKDGVTATKTNYKCLLVEEALGKKGK